MSTTAAIEKKYPILHTIRRGRSFRDTLFGKVRYGSASIEVADGRIVDFAVVIKEYDRLLVETHRTRSGDLVGEDAKEELRLHALLSSSGNRNIVKLWDVRKDEKYYYAILEFCSRGEFFPLVQLPEFTAEHAKFYFRQLINGLYGMHQMNIYHRDLSLENILLSETPENSPVNTRLKDLGELKICDFGVAVQWDKSTGNIKDPGVPVGKCVAADTEIRTHNNEIVTAKQLWEWKLMGKSLPKLVDEFGGQQSIRSIDFGQSQQYYEIHSNSSSINNSSSHSSILRVTPGHHLSVRLSDRLCLLNRIHQIHHENRSQYYLLTFNERFGKFELFQSSRCNSSELPKCDCVAQRNSTNSLSKCEFQSFIDSNPDLSIINIPNISSLSFSSSSPSSTAAAIHSASSKFHLSLPRDSPNGQRYSISVDNFIQFNSKFQSFFEPVFVNQNSLSNMDLDSNKINSFVSSPSIRVVHCIGSFDWIGFEVSSPSHSFVLASGLVTQNCRFYMAPEVFARDYYSPELYDCWCCGIILFVMLTRVHPFKFATPTDQRFVMIVSGQINELLAKWERPLLDPISLDLLCRMLTLADRRISVKDVLAHPFLNDGPEQESNSNELKMDHSN